MAMYFLKMITCICFEMYFMKEVKLNLWINISFNDQQICYIIVQLSLKLSVMTLIILHKNERLYFRGQSHIKSIHPTTTAPDTLNILINVL